MSLGRDFFTVPEGSGLEVWPQHILGREVKCNYCGFAAPVRATCGSRSDVAWQECLSLSPLSL